MKFWTLFFVAVFALPMTLACAQGRDMGGFPQQSQFGGFGATSRSAFGSTSQLGQQGSLRQSQFGRAGFGGQIGGFGGGQGFGGGLGIGGQRQPMVGGQDGFVGSDARQVRALRQDPRQQRRQLFDFAIESFNEMRESQRERRAQRNQPPPVRVQLRPLFTAPQPSSLELTTQVRNQFDGVLPSLGETTPQVTINGGTATIEGVVGSDYDKRLAAKMLSLQPGVSQVDNRLTIEQGPEDLFLPLPR